MIDVTKTHAFFYKEWPSNFFRAPFTMDGIKFFCTEQAFMYLKAKFFKDDDTADKILNAATPKEAKDLGREVRNYNDAEWDKVRYDMMLKANREKYAQNRDVCSRLLSSQYIGKTFVEASPIDLIWGIGMQQGDPSIDDESKWRGRNLLGKVITQVRDELIAKGIKAYE